MELLEDPVFKTKYTKNKLRVKLWESDFMDKYGRKPNKSDIKEADVSIKEAYKMYWKLKTRALEETLLDITFSDDVQANVSNQSPQKPTNDQKHGSPSPNPSPQKSMRNSENVDPHDGERETGDSAEQSNVDGAWGSHLRRNKQEEAPKKKHALLIGRSTSFQLSRTKFESSAFVKRNPRKSLSSTKLGTKLVKSSTVSSNSNTDRDDPDGKSDAGETEERKPAFGESIKVTFEGSKPVAAGAHSINIVQQLVDGHVTGVSRNLNQGWLERCMKDGNAEVPTLNQQRFSGTSDSGVESMESSIHSPKDSTPLAPARSSSSSLHVSDEDFICNSDSEEERKNKRIRNFRRHLSEQQDGPAAKRRRVEIGVDSSTVRSSDTTDANSFELTFDASSNSCARVSGRSENKTDSIYAFKSTPDIKTSFDSPDEPIGNRNDNVTAGPRVESNIKTKNEFGTIGATKSIDFVNREDSAVPDEKLTKQRVPRRKRKRVLSDDSEDPDYVEEDEKVKTAKKANTKKNTAETLSTRKSAGRRSKGKAKSASGEEEKVGVRRRSLRKKSISRECGDDENRDSDSKTDKIPTYSVETIQTIPRLAMKSTGGEIGGDLVAQFSELISVNESAGDTSTIPSRTVTTKPRGREILEKKMTAGTMNDNFVRINLKKKVFVRGKKNFNLAKYKKNKWKQRKKELASSESNLDVADLMDKNGARCFKCGEVGHFSQNCRALKGDALLPMEEIDESSSFPTLEEAERMANEKALAVHGHRIDRLPERPSRSTASASSSQTEGKEVGQVEEELAKLFGDDDFADTDAEDAVPLGHRVPRELASRLLPPRMEAIAPLYPADGDGDLVETPTEVHEALRMFGHESFRAGQEKAVMRILSGRSTLVTLSTGSGKSLCYQLPAYLYSRHHRCCITLVISPLVSLMDDQVMGGPAFLSAACLHTGQTPQVRERVMQSVKDGKVNVLLVSPEAVVAGEKSTGFGALLRQLPPIAFACIDEAHCISQWSHNFRPSYLMVCRVLKEKLGVRTVLGLTATATRATAENIARHLDLHDGMAGVISDVPLPKNLVLTVSKDDNKDRALVALLRSARFQECDSVIVYCTRREECVRIAELLRVSLKDPTNPEKPNAKVSATAEAYHAGMSATRRKIVQKHFMSGKTKIVVATVAFGMGINKSDIRAVIHYNMPGTFEGYVQEVGRAGRDGVVAHCHLFLNPKQDSDKWELRRHIHANSVDRHTIRRLLQRIFIPCSCAKVNENSEGRKCPGHEVALPIDELVQTLDITEETISTLLCYLELHPKTFITVLSSVYIRARVSSYNGPEALKRAAQSSPPLAMAIALDMQKGISHEDKNIIEFPVVDVASTIGWDSGVVKSHLKNLEWTTGADGKAKRSAISVHYDKLGLRVKAPGNLTDAELDEALEALVARTQSQESSCLQKLEVISSTLDKVSVSSIKHCSSLNDDVAKKSEELKGIIREYFQSDSSSSGVEISLQDKVTNEQQIAADVRSLIICYRDTNFTGRAVARIFHGIQSPNYPAVIWGRCRFWRIHLATNFNNICKIATKEILALR